MYRRNNTIITNKSELSNYVEGKDIYNSTFLYKLLQPELERKVYEITVYEYRPDLIAKDFYGSTNYMGILLLQAGIGLENMRIGTKLLLLDKSTVDNIIKNI